MIIDLLLTIILHAIDTITWLVFGVSKYYLLYLFTFLLWRIYKLVWCARKSNLLPVDGGKDAILITGATSGIGLSVSKYLFLKLGYSVIAAYYDDREPGYLELKELSRSTNNNGKRKLFLVNVNICDLDSTERAFEYCEQILQENNLRLYALINNAGLGSFSMFSCTSKKALIKIIETNITGTMLMTRTFLPLLIEGNSKYKSGCESARVLNVSSGLGLLPGKTYIQYGVTKAALIYFTRAFNCEYNKKFTRYEVKSISIVPENYTKITNIVDTIIEQDKRAWLELSGKERSLYKIEFDNLQEKFKIFFNSKKQLLNDKMRVGSELIGDQKIVKKSISQRIEEFFDRFKAKNLSSEFEGSGLNESFELALRLRDPPEEIFAGSKIFSLWTGSLLLTLPNFAIRFLSELVNSSLYE